MAMLLQKGIQGLAVLLLCALLALPQTVQAEDVGNRPSAGAMIGDALVARPLLLVTTVAGTGIYLASLPFTLLGGNATEAAEVLVLGPAKATFRRCLGCTLSVRREELPELR